MIHHQTSWPFYVIFISFNIANDFQKKKIQTKKKKKNWHTQKKILTFVSFLCYRLAVTTSISISLDSFIVFRLAFHSFFFFSNLFSVEISNCYAVQNIPDSTPIKFLYDIYCWLLWGVHWTDHCDRFVFWFIFFLYHCCLLYYGLLSEEPSSS